MCYFNTHNKDIYDIIRKFNKPELNVVPNTRTYIVEIVLLFNILLVVIIKARVICTYCWSHLFAKIVSS